MNHVDVLGQHKSVTIESDTQGNVLLRRTDQPTPFSLSPDEALDLLQWLYDCRDELLLQEPTRKLDEWVVQLLKSRRRVENRAEGKTHLASSSRSLLSMEIGPEPSYQGQVPFIAKATSFLIRLLGFSSSFKEQLQVALAVVGCGVGRV